MTRKESGSVLVALAAILFVGVLVVLGAVYWTNARQQAAGSIVDFDTCKADAGSRVQESFPETCVTSDGRSFAGPTDSDALSTGKTKTYCTTGEKLCFKYLDSWKVMQLEVEGSSPKGANGDHISVVSSDGKLTLTLYSGVDGFGGTCSKSSLQTLHTLKSSAIPKLKGFKDPAYSGYAYNLDKPRVARVITPAADDKFRSLLYVTSNSLYADISTLGACGTNYSNFNKGRNAIVGPEDEFGKSHGYFSFGTIVMLNYDAPTYATLKEAKAAYNSEVYQQAAAILASLYYK